MSQKVLDSGASTSDELKLFLSSPENSVILTEFWTYETFRRQHKIRESFSLLSNYPRQVIALRNDRTISELKPRSSGLRRRHISDNETLGFTQYCSKLAANAPGIAQDIAKKAANAEAYIQSLTRSADRDVRQGMVKFIRDSKPDDLNALRANLLITHSLLRRVERYVADMTAMLSMQILPNRPLAPPPDVKYSYQFRMAVAMCALTIHWATSGDVATTPAKKLRNDITDSTYTAHGSFFDGVITKDKKLRDINALNSILLSKVFTVPRL